MTMTTIKKRFPARKSRNYKEEKVMKYNLIDLTERERAAF